MGYREIQTIGAYTVYRDAARARDDTARVLVAGPGISSFPIGCEADAASIARGLDLAYTAGRRRAGGLRVDDEGIIWPD